MRRTGSVSVSLNTFICQTVLELLKPFLADHATSFPVLPLIFSFLDDAGCTVRVTLSCDEDVGELGENDVEEQGQRSATRVGIGQSDVRRSEPSHRDHVSAAIIRGEHDHGMKFANLVTHQCGFEGCRVGEASNPGPRIRRLLRPVEGRDVSRKPHRRTVIPMHCCYVQLWPV